MIRPASGRRYWAPRRFVADLVWAVHIAVMAFLVIGWAAPWRVAWWSYVILAPCVLLGWRIFADMCWLSIIEAKLRGDPLFVRERESGIEQSRSFVAETLSGLLRRPISRRFAKRLSYGVVVGGFLVAGMRLVVA